MTIRDSIDSLKGSIQERFASVWKLLYDTDRFLSRTPLFAQYEMRLREWRRELQLRKNDSMRLTEIRGEIVTLRRELRSRGYNLRLGEFDLEISGFRSDDALGIGFARAVLAVAQKGMVALAGQGNHLELQEMLYSRLRGAGLGNLSGMHSLWYRWDNRLLRISGADSETKDDFGKLRTLAESESMRIIAAFREL
jgi:hypothetical protein